MGDMNCLCAARPTALYPLSIVTGRVITRRDYIFTCLRIWTIWPMWCLSCRWTHGWTSALTTWVWPLSPSRTQSVTASWRSSEGAWRIGSVDTACWKTRVSTTTSKWTRTRRKVGESCVCSCLGFRVGLKHSVQTHLGLFTTQLNCHLTRFNKIAIQGTPQMAVD